ncbi:glycoside hydrolase family 36 protein [Paenibacillus contaminans]|uniref:Alpha-galactosidase n=1 Tax=Paenibacillus contaminans TaxID=450362 RepID=A0A329MB93_9BACL|nr:glycoside hydrolase family 36 protein [Paenibacillus contaminans]RAV16406.1 alpha-galactosidase [Paenibacillus contaminans]
MKELLNISINENGLYFEAEVTESREVRLLHFSPFPLAVHELEAEEVRRKFRIVEIQMTGLDQDDHHGSKYTGTMPGSRLKYVKHNDRRNSHGRKLEIVMEDEGLFVTAHYQFFSQIPVVRAWTEITNRSAGSVALEYVSSFALTGIAKGGASSWERQGRLYVAHNTWHGEMQWRSNTMPELGLTQANASSLKRLSYSTSGTWSSAGLIPMGCFENSEQGTALIWQIEHNGSWHWEISDAANHLYLQVSGPTENENHWWKKLAPGESFHSVPVGVGIVEGGFEQAVGELTRYRRAIRRPNRDNERLPVIFNDYMNCLFADPTTEKIMPLVDASARAGCEYYCIDAGWYADEGWWDTVGAWQPSEVRFPGGLKEVTDYIRSKGMVPGLWLELEVMGVRCPLASKVSDDWFFVRHGERVIDHGRYQLDYRNPEVVKYANEVIDRLVKEYGIGYIKMDYNINAGIGTEINADSFGDGLLQHNRAYLQWLDNVFERYPKLVIENCASGGMRIDYALLSRHSVQSSSDQTDYRKYAAIVAGAPAALTPEQCAVWSYPLRDGSEEEVIFNLVNCMLMRVHQSGHLAEISANRFELIREGLEFYKKIRKDLAGGLPFWPLGLPSYGDSWLSLGLRCEDKAYLAVWRLESDEDTVELPLPEFKHRTTAIRCGYPQRQDCDWYWDRECGKLTITMPSINSARLFEFVME